MDLCATNLSLASFSQHPTLAIPTLAVIAATCVTVIAGQDRADKELDCLHILILKTKKSLGDDSQDSQTAKFSECSQQASLAGEVL